MGGYGSGRRDSLASTEGHLTLDVRNQHRDGALTTGQSFVTSWTRGGNTFASIQMRTKVDRVILSYQCKIGDDEQLLEYPVGLDWTGCNFGGRRPWFLCPVQGCGQRVAVLYLGGSGIFACRQCLKLAYACQRETAGDRAMRKAGAIRVRMGWAGGTALPAGDKPKGMHWRTYERLKARHDAFANASLIGMAERLGLLNWRLADLQD